VKAKRHVLGILVSMLTFGLTGVIAFLPANAVGTGNIVVTNVYWGTNPLTPSTARPGDANVQFSVVLTNVGDDIARDVSATLALGPPLVYGYSLDGRQYSATSISKTAGDIGAGLSFTISFTVSIDSNSKEGIYRFNLQISYKSAREIQQVNKSVTIDVPVWRGELHIQKVVTAPTKIYPGSKQIHVKVTVTNSGRGTAADLRIRIILKTPFKAASSSSDRIFLGLLSSGQTSEGDFILDVADNATFGQYSLLLIEESGVGIIPIGEVPLYLNEKVRFAPLSVMPTELRTGETGRVIQVRLKNTGSIKAESVRIQLLVGNFFSGTLTDFLGNMLAGEEKVASFTVDIDSKAQPNKYTFDLRIDWTQDDNALDDTLPIPMDMTQSLPIAQIALAILATACGLGYLLFKRGKLRLARQPVK